MREFCRAFLNGEAEDIQKRLNIIMNRMISVLDAKAPDDKKENFYHGLLLGLLRSQTKWLILSNAESGDGFCDILIEPEDLDAGIVIEVKYAASIAGLDNACGKALAQIQEMRYEERLHNDGRTAVDCGLADTRENYMGEHIELFIRHLSDVRGKAENTIQCYKRDLLQFENYCKDQGITDSRNVTSVLLNSFILRMENSGKKPATVSRMIVSMKSFFQYLMDIRVIDGNPAVDLKPPRVPKKVSTDLDESAMIRLRKQISGTSPKELRDRAMLELLLATGIHVAEILSLRTEDVNLQFDFIVCHGGGRERIESFGREAKEALVLYLQKGRRYFVAEEEAAVLFTNCIGQPMSRQGLWKLMKYYGAKAGIKKELTVAALRHVQ